MLTNPKLITPLQIDRMVHLRFWLNRALVHQFSGRKSMKISFFLKNTRNALKSQRFSLSADELCAKIMLILFLKVCGYFCPQIGIGRLTVKERKETFFDRCKKNLVSSARGHGFGLLKSTSHAIMEYYH